MDAFFLDTPFEAKKFSLLTQKMGISLTDVAQHIETTISKIMNGCLKCLPK